MEFLVKAGDVETPTAESVSSDVHFCIEGDRRLVLQRVNDRGSGAAYLGYRIVDKPDDLRAHVQRILLNIGANDEPGIRGGLIDLFIALGDKGSALKQRMLGFAAPTLSKTAVAFLRKNIESGFQPWDIEVASTRTSLLSMGYIGVREIVSRDRGSEITHTVEHPVAQAHSQLEYGQLEQAVATLEEALRTDPTDKDVADLLDKIYQHPLGHPTNCEAPTLSTLGVIS